MSRYKLSNDCLRRAETSRRFSQVRTGFHRLRDSIRGAGIDSGRWSRNLSPAASQSDWLAATNGQLAEGPVRTQSTVPLCRYPIPKVGYIFRQPVYSLRVFYPHWPRQPSRRPRLHPQSGRVESSTT